MDLPDHIRLREAQQIVGTTQLGLPLGETLAAKVRFLQPTGLDHRPHRAIQNQDALAQQGQEGMHFVHVQSNSEQEGGGRGHYPSNDGVGSSR